MGVMGDEYEVQHRPSLGGLEPRDGGGDQQFCREVQRPCQLNLTTKAPSRWCGLSCQDALRLCRLLPLTPTNRIVPQGSGADAHELPRNRCN